MSAGGEAPAGRGLSPVIRSLRITGDEVQFGRVLAAICVDDSNVANAFVSSVVANAKRGNRAARLAAAKVPDDVRCVDEQRLEARVGRRLLRQRARDRGRVDLDFSGGRDWRLLIELKLGAGFGDRQLQRYAEEQHVAAIVRNLDSVPELRSEPGWVGAATWESLVADLRALEVDARWREQWLGLLDVMDTDGDFARAAPDGLPEVVAARTLLEAIAPDVLARFRADLGRTHGALADVACRRLVHTKPYGRRGPWAGFGIRTPGDGAWMFFEVRNLWSGAPRLRIWHWHSPEWRGRKEARSAYATLPPQSAFHPVQDGGMFDRPMPDLASATATGLTEAISDRVAALVATGVFERDLKYQQREYGGRRRGRRG